MSLLRRALTGASATVLLAGGLLAGGTAPATAATSAQCVRDSSTRLLTANDGEYKVWVQTFVSPITGYRETNLCWAASTVTAGNFVVRQPYKGALVPTVTPTTTDPACPRLLEIQDPVQLMTRLAQSLATTPGYLCFGVADGAYRVTFTRPSPVTDPEVALYLDKGTAVANTYCSTIAPTNASCRDPLLPYVVVAQV